MIEKEYTTIEKQIEILKDRKLIISDKDKNRLETYLLEYGYERVITGSNDLFKTSNENTDDYDENSKAEHLMMAFDIDRNISIEIFKYLSKSAEIKINTIIANTIAGILSEKELQKNGLIFGINDKNYQIIFPNYENKNGVWNLKKWIAGESIQNGLYDLEIKKAKKDLESSKKEIKEKVKVKINIENNIEEFKKKNNIDEFQAKRKNWILYLPIWKIANTWSLGSTINIFKYMPEEKRNEIIKNVCPKFSELEMNSQEFVEILFWIKKFRNMLAHNYSIYKMGYVLKENKKECNSYKLKDFIKKLQDAEIISKNVEYENKIETGIMTFVRLLEVFLNIEENKIQEAIEKIIEDKFNKKNDFRQLKEAKDKIQEIIDKKELQKDDIEQLDEIKEKIQKIIDKNSNNQEDDIRQLENLKEKIKDIINK